MKEVVGAGDAHLQFGEREEDANNEMGSFEKAL
jgi:hypothetical protein